MSWYLAVLKNYATFEGRARRKEFWMFYLVHSLINIALVVLDTVIFEADGFGIFSGIYGLALFIPTIAVTVRRLHDIGKSGWFYWVALIPLIGGIWLLIMECTDSEIGQNIYGPNPKKMEFSEQY